MREIYIEKVCCLYTPKILKLLTEDVLRDIFDKFTNSSIKENEPWVHFDATDLDIELDDPDVKITAIHIGGYSEGGKYDITFDFELELNGDEECAMLMLTSGVFEDVGYIYRREDAEVSAFRTLWRALVVRYIWELDITYDEAKKEVSI